MARKKTVARRRQLASIRNFGKFQITAAPLESDSGMKAFCADQSGTLRFDAKGRAAVCLSRGEGLNRREVGATVAID